MRFATATISLVSLAAGVVWATPSTTCWTPCTADIQAPRVWHLGIDSYFTVGKRGPGHSGDAFPTDVGIEFGIQVTKKIQAEVGFDMLEPADDPWYLNGKIGYPEGALGAGTPAIELGIFNLGLQAGFTNQNVLDIIVGKTLPNRGGRLHAALYYGNPGILRRSAGARENTGFMIAYDRWLIPGKWLLAADWASGKNAIGGGGVGVYHFFTQDVSVLAGPVWFNDRGINGAMKWTTQIDINF
jgi:hypothetical protein